MFIFSTATFFFKLTNLFKYDRRIKILNIDHMHIAEHIAEKVSEDVKQYFLGFCYHFHLTVFQL